MVEGDGCHRVAREHRRSLVGRRFAATSPNGRFKAGAAAIVEAGGVLLRIEVHGKNMFYFFGRRGGQPSVVVHIHFGMAGRFGVYKKQEPETTDKTRLRLEATVDSKRGLPALAAHLSAMTVRYGSPEKLYVPHASKLGPDPLRDDADPERFIVKCATAKKSIGLALMDQTFLAGVGNIYRSETLYEAAVHPEQPANTLTRDELVKLWSVIVRDMQDGFKLGSIWGKKKGPVCYGREVSSCGGAVRAWTMGGRNVFACAKRQRLDKSRAPVAAPPRRTAAARPGVGHIRAVVPAAVAEARKRRSGEGLAVQHVALKDDATLAGAAAWKRKLNGGRPRTAASSKRRASAPAAGTRAKAKAKAKVKAKAKAKATAKGKAAATGAPPMTAFNKKLKGGRGAVLQVV